MKKRYIIIGLLLLFAVCCLVGNVNAVPPDDMNNLDEDYWWLISFWCNDGSLAVNDGLRILNIEEDEDWKSYEYAKQQNWVGDVYKWNFTSLDWDVVSTVYDGECYWVEKIYQPKRNPMEISYDMTLREIKVVNTSTQDMIDDGLDYFSRRIYVTARHLHETGFEILWENIPEGSGGNQITYNINISCNSTNLTLYEDLVNVTGYHNSTYDSSTGWKVWANYTGNETIGGCSYPMYFNLSNDNITVNVTVTNETTSSITNHSVNEEIWLYLSGLSLDPSLMLFLFIGFFYYFANRKESFVLYILTVVVSLIAGVYYLGWEVEVTDRIIGISLLFFAIYSSYEALKTAMDMRLR